jgi:AraC-like DNA-binding protein
MIERDSTQGVYGARNLTPDWVLSGCHIRWMARADFSDRDNCFPIDATGFQFERIRTERMPVVQVRAASLTGFVEVAQSLGLDPGPLLDGAGLTGVTDADDDMMIDAGAAADLLEDAATLSGCMSFGLLMAERRSLSVLGAISLLLEHQVRPRDRIAALVDYQGLLGGALSIGARESDGVLVVSMDVQSRLHRRQAIELMVGVLYRALVDTTGGDWQPECVHFVHGPPGDLGVHRRFFACPIAFESSFNGLSCADSALAERDPAAEPALADHARRIVDVQLATAERDVRREIRRMLPVLLPLGRATLAEVGRELGLHPRSLQRRLAREGDCFADLLNTARRDLARRQLSNPSLPIGTIAEIVGFDTPSSFSRWFRVEFGQSPRRWRVATAPHP